MGVGCRESKSIASTSSRSSRRRGVDERHRWLQTGVSVLRVCQSRLQSKHTHFVGVDRANAARLSGVRVRVEDEATARARGRRVLASEAMMAVQQIMQELGEMTRDQRKICLYGRK